MKKKILIILLITLAELNEMANAENIDMDAINEKLDRTVTSGDYAVVENAFKSYLKENFNNSLQIAEILNDEKITTLNTSEKVLNLLSENKNNWEIQDEQIVFDNDSLSNQYDELINSL